MADGLVICHGRVCLAQRSIDTCEKLLDSRLGIRV